ncbi:unnamed protein product [Protopolystoma xenopodis]|uniref:Gamma tubulin complex component protein N-terminal domain-containing protein n=1 Tax=Protopolystoma xenopodis TaxID=117903 RepID=A0A448XJB5_9PLAT|nr:unnamed protein product [Protopolystoma xenopodis]
MSLIIPWYFTKSYHQRIIIQIGLHFIIRLDPIGTFEWILDPISHLDIEKQTALHNLASNCDISKPSLGRPTNEPFNLTRLQLWVRGPRLRLREMACLADVALGRKGGDLASLVYQYSLSGHPEIRTDMRHLLTCIASTLYFAIGQWMYDGRLDDPCQEFFVAANPTVRIERLWHDKYCLRRSMIPMFISLTQAKKRCGWDS